MVSENVWYIHVPSRLESNILLYMFSRPVNQFRPSFFSPAYGLCMCTASWWVRRFAGETEFHNNGAGFFDGAGSALSNREGGIVMCVCVTTAATTCDAVPNQRRLEEQQSSHVRSNKKSICEVGNDLRVEENINDKTNKDNHQHKCRSGRLSCI